MRLGAVFGEGRAVVSLAALAGAALVAAAVGFVALRDRAPGPEDMAAAVEETATGPAPSAQEQPSGPEAETAAPDAPDGAADAADATAPRPAPPSFDQIRVAPDGSTVVAGRAPIGADVSLRVDGEEIAVARAAADGGFASIFTLRPSDAPRIMSLMATTPEGEEIAGVESVIIAPFGTPAAPAVAGREPPAEDAGDVAAADMAGDDATAEETEADMPPAATRTGEMVASDTETGDAPVEEMAAAEMQAGEGPGAETGAAEMETSDELAAESAVSGGRHERDPPEEVAAAERPGTATSDGPSPEGIPADDALPGQTEMAEAPADDMPAGDAPDPQPPEAVATEEEMAAEAGPRTSAGGDAAADGTGAGSPIDPVEDATGAEQTTPGTVGTAAETEPPPAPAPLGPEPDVVAELAAPEAPAMGAAPGTDVARAPSVVIAGPDGIRVMQGAGAAPGGGTPGEIPVAQTEVQLDAIAYDREGDVILSGRGPADARLRILLNNQPIELGEIGPGGEWSLDLPDVDPGTYTLTVAQLSPEGEVESQVDTPFLREDPARIVASPMLVEAGASVITVQPGFTLWGIAEANFGEGIAYVQIFERNRDRIRDPHWIFPGQIFRLPDLPRVNAEP